MDELGELSLVSSVEEIPLVEATTGFFSRSLDWFGLDDPMLSELTGVGMAEGDGYKHTQELCVLKYDEAMRSPDRDGWDKAVAEEHAKFVKYGVWKPVDASSVPDDAKVLT